MLVCNLQAIVCKAHACSKLHTVMLPRSHSGFAMLVPTGHSPCVVHLAPSPVPSSSPKHRKGPVRVHMPCLLCVTAGAMQVSTVLGVAIEEEREQKAWSEGVAIWVAVIVVSLVGEQSLSLTQALLAVEPF